MHRIFILLGGLLVVQGANCSVLPTDNSLENDIDTGGIDKFKQSKYLPEKCTGGTVYNITDVVSLISYEAEWDCIFRAALPSNKVPEGALYGMALGGFGLSHPKIRSLAYHLWKGKMTDRVICNGTETYLGWNNALGTPLFPFVGYVAKFKDVLKLDPYEYTDDIDTVFIDYTLDIPAICPDLESVVEKHKETMVVQIPTRLKTNYPMNGVVDAIRFVGRQPDGGAIYMGKMYYRDHFTADRIASSGAYFTMLSYDPDVNPEFKFGDVLPPLNRDFFVRKPEFNHLVGWAAPVHRIIMQPIRTTKYLYTVTDGLGRDLGRLFKDVCFGVGSPEDNKRFNDLFARSQPHSNETQPLTSSSYFLSHPDFDHSHFNEL